MKVIEKQRNSKMCFICGMDNEHGVKAQFYSMEDKSVVSLFKFSKYEQSFLGRVHGGIITAMLDELGLRALWAYGKNDFGVTMNLTTKYRHPVPYDVNLISRGYITFINTSFLKANAKIYLEDGTVLSEADLTYRLLPISLISEADAHNEMCYLIEDGIKNIDLGFILD